MKKPPPKKTRATTPSGIQVGLLDAAAVDTMLADRSNWIFFAVTAEAIEAFAFIEAAIIDPAANTTTLMHPIYGALLLVKKAVLPIDQLQMMFERLGVDPPSREFLLEKDVLVLQ